MNEQSCFLVRQRFKLVGNTYDIYTCEDEETAIARVDQKIMALKEDLRAVAPDGSDLFRIKARRVFDPAARYAVTDSTDAAIGELQKAFRRSLARSTWRIYSPADEEVAWARERNVVVAFVRRILGLVSLVPIIGVIGDLLQLIPIPYHFDFFVGERKVGSFERKFSLLDRYVLDLTGEVEQRVDRRLALALAVGMDALQAR